MENRQNFSNLIYDYFVARILFRYYTYGDSLPSADTLCKEFNVSSLTVKAALRRMRSEGYISMGKGVFTKVIYKQSEEALEKHIQNFYSVRWHAIQDLYHSSELIFAPLLTECFRRMDVKDFSCLSDLTEQRSADDIMRFYCYTLQKLGNPLVMNLLWETSIFLGFPFANKYGASTLIDEKLTGNRLRDIISNAKKEDWNAVHDIFLDFEQVSAKKQSDYFAPLLQSAPEEKQLSFKWCIYRERPQLCCSLAMDILFRNYMGEYRETRFLPSYEKMAASFGVSVSTMRRTIRLLNELGAASSMNGKGTLIYPPEEHGAEPDFSQNAIRRNLAYFIQAFEVVLYTCRGVSFSVLSSLPANSIDTLTAQLELHISTDHCELALWSILLFLVKNSAVKGVKEIYGQLFGLLLWGYPMKIGLSEPIHFSRTCICLTRELLACLRKNDMNKGAEKIRELTGFMYSCSEQFLLSHGLLPEDLRMSPNLKLLLNE